jgi:molybdenum cofactor cytidylyltransferase
MNKNTSRLFAIIPAAGHSQRMGQPKLLLPLGNSTVIERVLAALTVPEILTRCVVIRRDDEPLRAASEAAGGWCVSPSVDPPDMRSSVQFAIEEIQKRYSPTEADGWILVPADHPVLSQNFVNALILEWSAKSPLILVPQFRNQNGHPTIFRWSLARKLKNIPNELGTNRLLKIHSADVLNFKVDDEMALCDLDTPEDYERLKLCAQVS